MRRSIIFILLCCSLQCFAAADTLALRYNEVASDAFNRKLPSVDSYLKQKDFVYDRPVYRIDFLDNLLLRILKFLSKSNIDMKWIEWLIYAICFFVITWALMKIFNIKMTGLFSREKTIDLLSVSEITEDMEADFDTLIRESKENGDYRKAVRYLYLKMLREMSRRSIIEWKIDKTNHEYMNELADNPLQPHFRKLSLTYEYIGYGEWSVSQPDYNSIESEYNEVFRRIYV